MKDLRKLGRLDLRIGAPLPWSCYDRGGRLLLRKGVAISFERQISRLLAEGLFIERTGLNDDLAPRCGGIESVFECLLALTWGLHAIFNELLGASPAPDVVERLRSRAHKIVALCSDDPDAAIAAIHLDFQNPYLQSHHVHTAILCALLGQRTGITDEELQSVVCGALTFDLGLAELAYLKKQTDPLDDDQLRTVNQHVERSVGILSRAGIEDPVWIDTVRQHHERWNGGGYPHGTACQAICVGARLLAVADSYTAMIRPRAFRSARTPMEAQGELFKYMNILYEERLCVALYKELGMFPPGAIVRLANGETAIVKGRNKDDGNLMAISACDSNDTPYLVPQPRDTTDHRYAIAQPLPGTECRVAAAIVRRIWS